MAMDIESIDDRKDKEPEVSAKLRGEAMAYALQSGVYSLAANLYEPYINFRVQKRFSGPDAAHPGKHGNYRQNLAGEIVGDFSGAAVLIAAEALVPDQLHACTRTMRKWVDPLYTSVARWVFASDKESPDFEKKVRNWADFHERNLVRSGIIMTTNVASNVATQKWLAGNPASLKLIFAGKLASSLLTTSLGLATRLVFPSQAKAVDQWVGQNVFMPLIKPDEPAELSRQ